MALSDVGLPDVGRWVLDSRQCFCCGSGLGLCLHGQPQKDLDAFDALLLAGALGQVVEHVVQNDSLICQHLLHATQVASCHLIPSLFPLGHQIHDFHAIAAASVLLHAERTQAGARRHSGQTL